jgi:hypothetical protein
VLELTNSLIGISLILSSLAAGAWVRLCTGPGIKQLDPAIGSTARKTEVASRLLMFAAVSSALAAALAITDWVAN